MDDEMDQLVEEVNQNLQEQEEARSSGSENSSRHWKNKMDLY